jgi:LuxR family maltose regulon positive regulatory protein
MHVGLAEVLIERDELSAAADHLAASAELGEAAGLPQHPYRWRVTTARLLRARGDLDGALALIDQALPLYATDFSPPVRPVDALRARVALARGDVDGAAAWAEGRGLGVDDPLTYLQEFEHITFARVLVARGSATGDAAALDQAQRLLDRLLVAAEEGGRIGSAIEVLVLLAALHRSRRDIGAATAAIEGALRRAEPEGHVRLFLHAGPAIPELLRSVAAAEGPTSYAARVSAGAAGAPPPATTAPSPGLPLVGALSERELDVLRLLRTDLSGPDIARELHVSLNTLRTHTRHIYAKVGATNRREAVSRAAALGL